MGGKLVTKPEVIDRLKGFDKESHANSLAAGIMKRIKAGEDAGSVITRANAVVKAVRSRGVSSFYAAEYAKVFDDPEKAMAARERLVAEFELMHDLTPQRAAKMTDCIVFSTAKRPSDENMARVEKRAHTSLSLGVPFDVTADVVYYNNPEADAELFARRCVETSLKKNKPLGVSESDLARRLASETPVGESADKRARTELSEVVGALGEFK